MYDFTFLICILDSQCISACTGLLPGVASPRGLRRRTDRDGPHLNNWVHHTYMRLCPQPGKIVSYHYLNYRDRVPELIGKSFRRPIRSPQTTKKLSLSLDSLRHMRYNSFVCALAALSVTACNTEHGPDDPGNSKWISRVVEYRPAPGQFINTFQGNVTAAEGIVGGRNGCLSLGGFGGYVIFEFDHEVRNIDGTDFVIFGNAFDGNSEPGIVEVSPDGNVWYRLQGSEDGAAGTLQDYTIAYTKPAQTETAEDVPWSDNRGGRGTVRTVTYHTQPYWPLFLPGNPQELSFSGVRLPDNSSWSESGNKYVQTAFAWGYADNWSADYNEMVGNDPDTRASNKFDLDNAVDRDGNPVVLTAIRQIKVYTALNQWVGNGVGETSIEVCGALSLSADL